MPATQFSRIDLDKIYPPFLEKVLDLVANCNALGHRYVATSGYRSPDEQRALWQLGRNAEGSVTNPSKVVTRVLFGAHNAGCAVDFSFDTSAKPGLQPSWNAADYEVLATQAEILGLEAGAHWKSFKDAPHIQLPLGKHRIMLATLRQHYETAGNLTSAWQLLDKTSW